MKKILLFLMAGIATVCNTACAQKKTGQATDGGRKVLVAYVSMTGTTAKAAQLLAKVTGGELYEIVPEKRYTDNDLDWRNEKSRCFVEMHNLNVRPAISNTKDNIADYDVIYLGYPIWWNIAPTLLNTFIESHNLKGKTIIPFATSGGSTIDNTVNELKRAYPDINWQEGRLLNGADEKTVSEWICK